MSEAKQVLVIRRDLGMRRGKEIAQGAHASMAWLSLEVQRSRRRFWRRVRLTPAEQSWLNGAFTKVTCQVRDEAALLDVLYRAQEAGLRVHAVTDAGRTEFHGSPTVTALAVGPDWAPRVDAVTGGLSLY